MKEKYGVQFLFVFDSRLFYNNLTAPEDEEICFPKNSGK